MEEFINRLGLDLDGDYNKYGNYVVDIPDSNVYGKVYSKLQKNPELDEDDTTSITTHEMSSIQFNGDRYIITLIGNLDDDNYRLIVKER